MGCQWCNTKLYSLDYYGKYDFDVCQKIVDGDYTELSMLWNSKTNKFGLYASGEGEAVVNIGFCPNCGRKL